MPSILLFGATGLMGGHLAIALKKAYPSFPLTVYVRDTSDSVKAYLTESVHVDRIVYGDFSEAEKISKLAAEHEIVINCGSSWDVPLAKAINAGLKVRFEDGKGKATLVHISGTGNFVDERKDGSFGGAPIGNSKAWNVSLLLAV
jgi:nucleoside-diphosphate-sugar epimerase